MKADKATPAVLQAMLGKAGEKLAVARDAFASGYFAEVSSRSYYAVYHPASAVLAGKGMSFSSHAQTLGAFNREFIKTGIFPKDTYKKLQRLFENRQIGDYDWSRTINKKTAAKDLADVECMVELCRDYIGKEIQGTFPNR